MNFQFKKYNIQLNTFISQVVTIRDVYKNTHIKLIMINQHIME